MKVNINKKYFKEEEVRKNSLPYKAYYEALSETFDLTKINGICDVGCASGWVLHFFKNDFQDKKVHGIEYFDWHKESAPSNVKKEIEIRDIRDPLSKPRWYRTNFKYDIVNCTEVGEHIEPERTQIFLDNLRLLCNRHIIITWASSGGKSDRNNDPHLQHLNPLSFSKVKELLKSSGFKHENELSKKMLLSAKKRKDFHPWWRQSLSVWSV